MIRDKNLFPGLFIVFEGLDGTGKSTQIQKLLLYLKKNNFEVDSFYQPTHGDWGKKLRELFKKGHIVPIREEIQYSVNDRRESVNNQILPSLKKNNIVLLDRYFWSNAAYQGILNEPYDYVLKQNEEFPEPDIIIYFEIEVETANKRILNERKEIPNQYETINHLTQSKKIFDQIMADKSFTGKLIIIQAGETPENVFNQIKNELMPIITNWQKEKM